MRRRCASRLARVGRISFPVLRRRQVFVEIKGMRPSGEKHPEESSVVARSRRGRLVLCRERGRALHVRDSFLSSVKIDRAFFLFA